METRELDTATILVAIDQESLTDLVRRAQHSDTFVVTEWEHRATNHNVNPTP